MGKPEGVRVHRTDTDEWVDCELIHKGVDDEGMDCWLIAGVVVRPDVDEVLVAVMPAMTGIGFTPSHRPVSMTIEGEDP